MSNSLPPRDSTQLPPVRRKKRRSWGRLLARIMCVVFAIVALLPVGVGLLVNTSWARGIAEKETRKVIKGYGVEARYDLELHLWPLSVGLRNLRVESTDGQGPFLTARRATARPKIFGLLAGKLVIDEIEIVQPSARIVLIGGELKNLDLKLPETKRSDGSTKPPFSVISTSEANVDITIDTTHLVAKDIDADVTTDDADGGTAFEVAVRAAEARSKMIRSLPSGEYAVDEDLLCRIDGRARIEPKRIVVRRLSAHGVADLDDAEETGADCNLPKTDKRYVEIGLGHFTFVKVPPDAHDGDLPGLDGHIHVRGPLKLIERWQKTPGFDGFATLDAEVRIPAGALALNAIDATARLEITNLKIYKFEFSRHVDTEITVRGGVLKTPRLHVEIAKGIADFDNVEVGLIPGKFPLKATLDIHDIVFTKLLQDLKIHPHPHVTWDVNDLKVARFEGTIMPLNLEGDMIAHTSNFAVYDHPMDFEGPKQRATGVKEGVLQGRLGIHPKALEFMNTTVIGPHSVVRGMLVSIGYTEAINVVIPSAQLDLGDLSPLGSVPISGLANLKATVTGQAGDPRIAGEVIGIKGFSIGDKPNDIAFGDITNARVHLEGLSVILEDVRAQKNKSTFEMPTGRLDFGGEANLRMDGAIVTKGLDVRDFFSVFHMDEDPRFEPIHAQLEANARVHLALGGPEDICHGGFLDVQGTTIAHQVEAFGEKFDEAQADFEYKWTDRQAGIEGADIDIRSISLSKVKKEGRPAIGNILGSVSVQRGGDLRGSLVMQGYPLQRADLLGPSASFVEGSVSGVARLGGTVSAFDIEADVDVSPIRILGAPFGSSDLHVLMTQKSDPVKEIGRTFCKGRITAAFDKDVYQRTLATSVSGDITVSGKMFNRQIALEDVKMTRQAKPVVSGKVSFDKLDLGPIGRLLLASGETDEVAQNGLGGELTGVLSLEKLDTADPGHAKGWFEPKTIKLARGGQRLEWRPPVASMQTRIDLADDKLVVPPMVFDLAAGNGFKGSVGVTGAVNKVTHGAELALDAELTPIDLGILVGIVPRLTRAGGSLAGKLHVAGTSASPAFNGQLRVRAGDFAFKGVPGGITDVDIDIDADENEATISRGKGHFLGGDVGITARMPITSGSLGTIEANVTGRQLFVSLIEGVKSTVDADLVVTMNPSATSAAGRLPFVSGDVTITAFEYTKPFTLELNGLTRANRTAVAESYDPAGDSVSLGIDVRSRVPLRLRNNMIDAQLAIDPRGVHVTGTNQRIGLRGDLTMLNGGRFRVFANDFDLQKGKISFDDATRILPHIDITAVTEYRRYTNSLTSGGSSGAASGSSAGAAAASGSISGGGGSGGNLWRITVHAFGDTDKLQIDVSSDPPLSREDIFFLLTIGLTRAEVDLVQAGSVYGAVAFEAFGTATGVDRAVKQAIPVIDDFRPGTAYSPRTGRVEPNITVGKRLTDTIRARLTSGLAEDPQLRSTIEWRLNRHFTLEPSYDRVNTVSSSNIGNFGIDFRWSLEFD